MCVCCICAAGHVDAALAETLDGNAMSGAPTRHPLAAHPTRNLQQSAAAAAAASGYGGSAAAAAASAGGCGFWGCGSASAAAAAAGGGSSAAASSSSRAYRPRYYNKGWNGYASFNKGFSFGKGRKML